MIATCKPHRPAHLSDLIRGHCNLDPEHDIEVLGLSCDSRSVEPGDVFFARRGANHNGALFFDAAVRAGAVALVGTGESAGRQACSAIPRIAVEDVDACLGDAAHRFFGEPSRHMAVVGLTGTNGKSSTCHFVAQALEALRSSGRTEGRRCGLIGTLGYGTVDALQDLELTTPNVVSIHRILGEFHGLGLETVLMEVSSHALSQQRVAGVAFNIAVFTNLTRDHLDYHGDMSSYGEAKRQLFVVPGLDTVVVNSDDPFAPAILEMVGSRVRVITYGFEPGGPTGSASHTGQVHLHGEILSVDADGTRLRVAYGAEQGEVNCRIIGRFNGANILATIATLLALDLPLTAALEGSGALYALPGRMERFGAVAKQPLVIVDYAHTPDALDNSLRALREICAGRLWCVFGCGGDRDRGKRPMMANAAQTHADVVVVTDDNPRFEDGDRIIADICAALHGDVEVLIERDRRNAIETAVSRAGRNDAILVAGKGHEAYQEVAGVRRPFSDATTVRAALEMQAS